VQNFGEIDGITVGFTDHALARMVEMGVTPEEIRGLITNPEETYQSTKYPDATCQRKGKYSIALRQDRERICVITILYGSLEDWCEAARDGKLGDRKLKMTPAGMPRRRRRDA